MQSGAKLFCQIATSPIAVKNQILGSKIRRYFYCNQNRTGYFMLARLLPSGRSN
jgi:hypothetical protein